MKFQLHSLDSNKIRLRKLKKYILYACIGITLLTIALVAFSMVGPKNNAIDTFLRANLPDNLEKDEYGFINFLIAGSGGENHIGGELTDALMVASVDTKNQHVILMSIPRDLFISHENIISQRINSVYENHYRKIGSDQALKILREVAEEVTGITIPYHIKLNFKALEEVVDHLGGVEVYNPELLYDPYYPGPNYTYQTFKLQKGLQFLNGSNALKYARSRKTTSDFSRSKRQQDIILAIKNKALNSKILTNPKKLQELFDIIKSNIVTNLNMEEIVTLALKVKNISHQDIRSLVLSNDFSETGGFLYTPPREQYNNAFVLKAADETYSQIHLYFLINRIYFDTMQYLGEVVIKNGTYTSGLAGKLQQVLKRYGINSTTENADTRPRENSSILHYDLVGTDTLNVIDSILHIEDKQELEIENPDLGIKTEIILGKDFISKIKQLDSFTNVYDIIFAAKEKIPKEVETGSNPESNFENL